MLPSIEDPSQTDRVTANAADCSALLTITLTTSDLVFQSPVNYGHDPYTWKKIGADLCEPKK